MYTHVFLGMIVCSYMYGDGIPACSDSDGLPACSYGDGVLACTACTCSCGDGVPM